MSQKLLKLNFRNPILVDLLSSLMQTIREEVSDPGSMPCADNRRWSRGSSCTSDRIVTMNLSWHYNPWASESSEARNRRYQWLHKMDLGPTKTLKKFYKNTYRASTKIPGCSGRNLPESCTVLPFYWSNSAVYHSLLDHTGLYSILWCHFQCYLQVTKESLFLVV